MGIFKNLCDAYLHHWAFEIYLCESHLAISEHGISKSAYYCSYIMASCVSHPTALVIQLLKYAWDCRNYIRRFELLVVSYPLIANLCRALNLFVRDAEESARFLIKTGNDWCSVLQAWHSSKNWVVGVPASLLGHEQDRGHRGQPITQLDFRRQILH